MEFRSEDFGLLRNFIRRAVKKPTWWVFKDKLLQARAQQLQKLKGMLQKAKVDGQRALGTAQTHKRSTQEHSRVWPLPEDAEEVLGKPKLGWNLWDMKDTKDTCSCRHNKEGWGKHGPGAQWGRRPSELGHGRGTWMPFCLGFHWQCWLLAFQVSQSLWKCYRRGLSTEEREWSGADGMCLVVQKAGVSALPFPAVWQAVAVDTLQLVPHPFPSWGCNRRPCMVMVICSHTKDHFISSLKLK